ncbi:hypothetical protein OV203_47240 [Nannocystis sp. ILAH1]|uniref:hypothetical protein n=1 Tax=Nannocystis sp. ILAH1 TaxID=2996789 RepID=UPI00226DE7BC|nr:hypothetical protein [Nannocystis sp. ILAH1]MCY0994813.1 hypothetical protein [Nannocystis sp. ILAH1]
MAEVHTAWGLESPRTSLAPGGAADRLGLLAFALLLVACASSNDRGDSPSTRGEVAANGIELGAWTTLDSEGGGAAVVVGEQTIAVGLGGHAVIWDGARRVASVTGTSISPGRPRVVGGRVAWGPNLLALDAGTLTSLKAAEPLHMPMDRGDVVRTYAWSGDGAWLARSVSTHGGHARVTIHDGTTGKESVIAWAGSDLAPEALWVGPRWLAIGVRQPRVVDLEGRELATIDFGDTPLSKLEATLDERWLIGVELNRAIALIDTSNWAVVARWEGPWADAAIAPDGAAIVGLELDGKLRLACVDSGGLRELDTLTTFGGAVTVLLGADAIVLVGSGVVRRASLRVACQGAAGSLTTPDSGTR